MAFKQLTVFDILDIDYYKNKALLNIRKTIHFDP